MKKLESPGAVEAAHGASETDDLGRRVDSESILARGLTQGLASAAPTQQSCGARTHLLGLAEGATDAADPFAQKSQAQALRIIIKPTKSGRKWVARLGDRVLCVAAAPFVKSARLLLAEGYPAETTLEMWRPNILEWALGGRLGAVAATAIDGEKAPRGAKNGLPSRFPGIAPTTTPAGGAS